MMSRVLTAQSESRERRCRRTAGFTLVEVLATVAIMVLAGVMVAAGIPAAQRAYVAVATASDAQVLLSTTTNRLRDELSVAKPSTVEASGLSDGELVSFESYDTGYDTTIKNETDGLHIYTTAPSIDGSTATEEKVDEPLVPQSATAGVGAGSQLITSADSIRLDDDGVFVVSGLKVMNGTEIVANATVSEFKVRPLAS